MQGAIINGLGLGNDCWYNAANAQAKMIIMYSVFKKIYA